MTSAAAAMATWVGALARGGILMGRSEELGAELAFRVLGERGLARLREHFAKQSADVVQRERRGAIHACIWMAHADRRIVREEMDLIGRIIAHSDLPNAAQEDLEAAIVEPQDPEWFADEVTQPELRELILALSWELARIDGRLDEDEREAHRTLANVFGVSPERAKELRQIVLESNDEEE